MRLIRKQPVQEGTFAITTSEIVHMAHLSQADSSSNVLEALKLLSASSTLSLLHADSKTRNASLQCLRREFVAVLDDAVDHERGIVRESLLESLRGFALLSRLCAGATKDVAYKSFDCRRPNRQ